MSIDGNRAFLTAALVVGLASMAAAAGNESEFSTSAGGCANGTNVDVDNTVARRSNDRETAKQSSSLSRQAPLGHRQPRMDGVPANTSPSPFELEQRQLDRDLDRRLIICHRC
jgi:hypothetical protein